MRYHLDEDESQLVSDIGRSQFQLDIVSSHELGLEGMTDGELLRSCGIEGRCVVTKNGKDFISLTHRFQAENLPHAGVLIIPRSIGNDEFARIARSLAWFHELYPDGAPRYFVDYLRDAPDDWA